jgi:multidrug resistance efflux pump
MTASRLDHDNARSLANLSADLHELVKQGELVDRFTQSDFQAGVAESLAEISTQTKAIADHLESIDMHLVEWLDRQR